MIRLTVLPALSLLMFTLFNLFDTKTHAAEPVAFEVGRVYHGFKLQADRTIPEIDARGLLFEHTKSGARLLKMVTADDNRVFSITFKTPPPDDTGVPHIIEHSVLNGSRKFPVKSPFNILRKGSLNTFLNAMTGSDLTLYPIASRNDREFFNMMDVYLDAVFYPKCLKDRRIFLQEAWRYEIAGDELALNGVVYNEMKGAYSNPIRIFYRMFEKTLFPDNAFGRESGGLPEAIPTLTYEKFVAFHKKHYHPSNSYILLYGNGDTGRELAFLDREYLSVFNKKAIATEIPLQKPLSALQTVEAEYPISSGRPDQDQAMLGLAWVAGGNDQPELGLALEVLADVLMNREGSPLKRALLEAKIGKNHQGMYSNDQQGTFALAVQNASEKDRERFRALVFETLAKVVKEGIDKRLIEASINHMEFALREADFRGFPKGLVYLQRALPGWMALGDPFRTLAFEQSLSEVKKALSSPLLEGLIEKYLLGNTHAALVSVRPKKGLEEEQVAALKDRLQKVKAAMGPAELKLIAQSNKALKAYQEAPDRPADVRRVPMLALKDLEPKTEKLDVKVTELSGLPAITFEDLTRQIIYVRLYFDTRNVPQPLIPYVALFSSILGRLSTSARDFGDLESEIDIKTGGLWTSAEAFVEQSGQSYYPKLMVSTKCTRDKIESALELISEILLSSKLDDLPRLREILNEDHARLQMSAESAGVNLAVQRLLSYLSESGAYQEILSGASYLAFISDLTRNFDAKASEIVRNLQEVARLVLNRGNLLVGATGTAEEFAALEKALPKLASALGQATPTPQKYVFDQGRKNEGLFSSSKVQYVVQGFDLGKLGYTYDGRYAVLSQVLTNSFLLEKVREQGGAYGGWASLSKSGPAFLASYRDPNLQRTLDTYQSVDAFLKGFKPTEQEMTRYIIGTISGIDRPLTPSLRGDKAFRYYLTKVGQLDRQRERDEILRTKADDIRSFSKMMSDIVQQRTICVYGNEALLKKNKELFTDLVEVVK